MTIDDLPPEIRSALRAGWAEGESGYAPPPLADGDPVDVARSLGAALAAARWAVLDASVAEYSAAEAGYDAIVAMVNERYGADVAVLSDEFGPGGPQPGFR